MNQIHLSVADHLVAIQGAPLVEAVDRLDGFRVFRADHPEQPALATFQYADLSLCPALETLYYQNEIDGFSHDFGRYAQGYIYESVSPEGEVFRLWKPDAEHVVYLGGAMILRVVRFALWLAYGLSTAAHDTIALHTSCIVWGNRAIVFLGESGTGKSTHTRLWREHIAGAHLLNDDSPILRYIDGKVWMYGSPWSGKTPCYHTDRYELAGCVRLSQAPYNKIRRLSTLQAYGALHPSCPPDFAYDDQLYDHISHTLGQVIRHTPVFHLECLPDEAAARLSFSTIFPDGRA